MSKADEERARALQRFKCLETNIYDMAIKAFRSQMQPDDNGDWVQYKDVEAALSAVREECAKIAENCYSSARDNFVWECAQKAIAKAIRQQGLPCSQDGASANIRTGALERSEKVDKT